MIRSYFTFALLLLMLSLGAQEYSLPRTEVLKTEKIKSIKLYQHILNPLEGWIKSDSRAANDTVLNTYTIGTFHCNENGQLDSLDYYKKEQFGGIRIRYDEQGRAIYYFESTINRPNYKEFNMVQDTLGWIYRVKIDGIQTKYTRLNTDSIPLFDSSLIGNDFLIYRSNLITEEYETKRFVEGILGSRTYQHWIMKDGLPDSLIMESEFFTKRVKRAYPMRDNGLYTEAFKVLPTGEIAVTRKSSFYYGLENFNFNMRQNKFMGITPNILNVFRAESLIKESYIFDNYSFDGKNYRHYYEIFYEYR